MGNLDCPLWIWVVICHKKQLVRNEWLLVVISNTVLRTLQKSEGNCGGCWSFCGYHYTCWHFSPASLFVRGVWDKQHDMETYLSSSLQNTKSSLSPELCLRSNQKGCSKTSNEISKAVAGNENPVFEDFFLNVVLLFFLRGRVAFFTVLARFHSCFHIFIMVPLLDSPKLWDFLQLTSKNMICCSPWFRIWAATWKKCIKCNR